MQRGDWRETVVRTALRLGAGVVLLAACWGCSGGGDQLPADLPRLSPRQYIGRTPAQMVARLGQPQEERAEAESIYGFLRWPDVDGVGVLAIVVGGKGTYVSYQFPQAEPFDEAAALRRLGLEAPAVPPTPLTEAGAKRWVPFGPYERLTVNPVTRLVAVGSHPML